MTSLVSMKRTSQSLGTVETLRAMRGAVAWATDEERVHAQADRIRRNLIVHPTVTRNVNSSWPTNTSFYEMG